MQAIDDIQTLRVSVLGSLTLTVGGRDVEVPGTKRRAVLALLALAAPDAVSADRLVDALWPDDPPASGRAALQSHVSRLRRHLGEHAGRLGRTDAGYRLELRPGELDAAALDAAHRRAKDLAGADPAAAAGALSTAVSRWRGPPLAELTGVDALAVRARALTEAWLDASDLLADCALRAGDAGAAAGSAGAALAVEPLREASVHLLVRALAAQHRYADALRAAHDFRQRLAEETGLDASPALADLEHEVAAAGPALTATRRPPPVPSGPFLGREAELAGVTRLLASERLVTIVGTGGVGKTRLALEVARRASADTSVTFVALEPVTHPDALPDVVARAVGVEAGQGDPLERGALALQGGPHLLIVDNCEHVLPAACRVVTTLLDSCPELTVLATSRERLGAPAEQTTRLAPLPMPAADSHHPVESVPAVALLLDRARRARPDLSPDPGELIAMAEIVRALDGIPLAIELAAGRLSSMSAGDLRARLDRALDLLARGPEDRSFGDGRHRTLRAAVQWSYDLLPEDEQRLFRHLCAFPGGFDLATAERVAADVGLAHRDPATALAHLVDSSMVVAELDGAPRYRMLDTLRGFGVDRLSAAGELEAALARLLRWAVDLSAALDAAYDSDGEVDADRTLRVELPNLRAAWRAARDAGDMDVGAALAVNLFWLAFWRQLSEQFRWFLELAADPRLGGHEREAQVLGVASAAAWASTGDLERAEELARRSMDAVRPGDDLGRFLGAGAWVDVMLFRGRFEEAAALSIEASSRVGWKAEGYAQAALAAVYGGDGDSAREYLSEGEGAAGGPTLRAYLRYVAGELANFSGDWSAARAAYEAAIDGSRAVGASFVESVASVGLVTVLAADGDVAGALAGYRDLIARWERTGAWTQQWTTLRNLADLLERLGDRGTAATLRRAADAAPESAFLAAGTSAAATSPGGSASRDEVLDLARRAIEAAAAEAVT